MPTGKNANFFIAKVKKNDEFYTLTEDIASELSHYKEYLAGKTVYCNCDDPDVSNFYRYLYTHFSEYELKRLISTCFVKDGKGRGTAYDGKRETPLILSGDGDFRSEECVDLLKQADTVITNPPFSLFSEFVSLVLKYEKDFLIVGKENAVSCKDFFPLLKSGQVHKGYHKISTFVTPEGENRTFGNTCWFTTLPMSCKNRTLTLTECYFEADGVTPKPVSNEKYPVFYNYDAINVDKLKDIPCDYKGIMGVPISIFDYWYPCEADSKDKSGNLFFEYEVIGTYIRELADEMGIKAIGKEWCDIYYSKGGKAHMSPNMHNPVLLINGEPKMVYQRVFIKQRKNKAGGT